RLDQITPPILVRSFPPGHDHGPPPTSGSPPPGSSPSQGVAGSGGADSQQQAAGSLVQQLSRSDVAIVVLDAQGAILDSTQLALGGDPAQVPVLPAEWAAKIKS